MREILLEAKRAGKLDMRPHYQEALDGRRFKTMVYCFIMATKGEEEGIAALQEIGRGR